MRTTPGARPLCPAPGSRGARRADTQRLLPRDFSPRLVALAPPRWCGGGVFCCAPRLDYHVGPLLLDRCPGPSKYPPCSAGKRPISLAHAATRGTSSASACENMGCCGKKRTAFAEKSTVFRANSPTFHEDKQRAKKKAVKRNFKFPSADLDVPHFPLTGRSVEGRNSPLSGSERARFAADRPLSAKRHRTSAHPPPLFALSLLTNPKNQEACSLPLPHIHRKSTPNGALLRPKHQVKRNLSNKIPYYNACFSKIHLLPLQHIQYNKAAFPNGRRIV